MCQCLINMRSYVTCHKNITLSHRQSTQLCTTVYSHCWRAVPDEHTTRYASLLIDLCQSALSSIDCWPALQHRHAVITWHIGTMFSGWHRRETSRQRDRCMGCKQAPKTGIGIVGTSHSTHCRSFRRWLYGSDDPTNSVTALKVGG